MAHPTDTTERSEYLERARAGFERIDVGAELRQKALGGLGRWLREDVFASARPQLERLIRAENHDVLFDSFFQEIPFGTGGRRGPVGFGTNRINHHTISTSIQGHCEFLKERWPGRPLAVVIAYDVRVFHDLRGVYDPSLPNPLRGVTSRDFARVAAEVYAANEITVWFPSPESKRYVSTPELSFAIRALGAQGGLNISASHNHPDDNGAKVYNDRGGQEVPPLDEQMARVVESIRHALSMDWDAAVREGRIRWIPPDVHDSYITTNLQASIDPSLRSARIVFTPLHGTGWSSVGDTLSRAGFAIECFPEQEQPDGTFPTVPFRSPNPEVRESLRAVTEYGRAKGADLVLAADPDADRLGMVVPDAHGEWTFLSGNEIGTLLASYVFESRTASAKARPFACTTVVTTSLFRRIASACGVACVSDLPIGFKYIADVLAQIEDSGRYASEIRASIDDFLLGIEESHGYLVIHSIRDKDAAGAALLLAELASRLKDEGQTLLEHLDGVYRRFGYVANRLVSTVMLGAQGYLDIRKIQKSLREHPPSTVGGVQVTSFEDRWDERTYGPILSETDRAARDLLTFELANGARIVLRPSGTEPKNKIYVEAAGQPVGASASDESLLRAKADAARLAHEVARQFTHEMLSRIQVSLPGYALEVSDLVPLQWKRHFADAFMPEIVKRLSAGQSGAELEQWIDESLKRYGADGRLLVRNAVSAYCREEKPPAQMREGLERYFSLDAE